MPLNEYLDDHLDLNEYLDKQKHESRTIPFIYYFMWSSSSSYANLNSSNIDLGQAQHQAVFVSSNQAWKKFQSFRGHI